MDLYYLVILKDGKVRVKTIQVSGFVDLSRHVKEDERLITIRSESYAEDAAQIAYWAQLALDMQAELIPPAYGRHTQELFNVADFK